MQYEINGYLGFLLVLYLIVGELNEKKNRSSCSKL